MPNARILQTLSLLVLLPACVLPPEGSFAEECSDDLDNDGNGAMDCDDAACAESCANAGCRAQYEVCINEFMADNSSVPDNNGEYSDWIELYNPSGQGRSLDGFAVTDDLESPEPYRLDGLTISGRSFLMLWASGDVEQGAAHLPFKLSAGGDSLGLYCPGGESAGELEWSEDQGSNVSTGRIPDCEGPMTPGLTPTPMASNTP